MNPLPTQYKPIALEEFIGPAQAAGRMIDKAIGMVQDNHTPLKFLINGDPGIGKSALAIFLRERLGVDEKFSYYHYNGTAFKIDTLATIEEKLQYADWFGGWRLIHIDEADKIPAAAQVRFLTTLDNLPKKVAVVCTSNCQLEQFENRFQTRFQTLNITRPDDSDIVRLLSRWELTKGEIASIVLGCCGNVRAALLDAQTAMMAAA